MKGLKALLVIWFLIIVANVGAWLMGVYGIEVTIGSEVYGRHVDIVNEETPTSWWIGVGLALGAGIAILAIIYRNR